MLGELFTGPILGKDLLIGGVILAIMILPTITAVSREILLNVPGTQREGMIALGQPSGRQSPVQFCPMPGAVSLGPPFLVWRARWAKLWP